MMNGNVVCWATLLTAVATLGGQKSSAVRTQDSRQASRSDVVDFARLLAEMSDLDRLARSPQPGYRCVQFSSYDRRSTRRDAPHWFANADGFGREPIPGFEAVLRKPDAQGAGEYLVCDVEGPGVIVRTWTAGMGGTLRVELDGAKDAFFVGSADKFLRDRTTWLVELGLDERLSAQLGNAFEQEDADYLPIPFAKRLRITWSGRLRDLHFYQIGVRRYDKTARVRSFDLRRDLDADALLRASRALRQPEVRQGEEIRLTPEAKALANGVWRWGREGSGTLSELVFEVDEAALDRRDLLRIAVDGASVPQVEAPLYAFFGTGPGVFALESLPVSREVVAGEDTAPKSTARAGARPAGAARVGAARTDTRRIRLRSRWPVPFEKGLRIEVIPASSDAQRAEGARRRAPILASLQASARIGERDPTQDLRLFARWRTDRGLVADRRGVDLPFVVAQGRGRLVGVASILSNPSGIPTPGGSWWGEGDEKIFVDDDAHPSFFGTGSEDFYNYSWSRPGLFAHPYCGQPLCTGPACGGLVSNHRFLILDDVPFAHRLAFFMELLHHRKLAGVEYARIAWLYAAPGLVDDHQSPSADDLRPMQIAARSPSADAGARGALFCTATTLCAAAVGSTTARFELGADPLAIHRRAGVARLGKNAKIPLEFAIPKRGRWRVRVLLGHGPDAPTLRYGRQQIDLGQAMSRSYQSTDFAWHEWDAGKQRIELICTRPGTLRVDFAWLIREPPPLKVPRALEAEDLARTATSPGLELERQAMQRSRWSNGHHLWVKATRKGAFVELEVPVERAGRQRVVLRITKSWDYGILEFSINGKRVGKRFDTYSRQLASTAIDLGVQQLTKSFRLRLEVVGSNAASDAPHYYFGLDCVQLLGAD